MAALRGDDVIVGLARGGDRRAEDRARRLVRRRARVLRLANLANLIRLSRTRFVIRRDWNLIRAANQVPMLLQLGEREAAVAPRRHEEVLAVRRREDRVEALVAVARRERRSCRRAARRPSRRRLRRKSSPVGLKTTKCTPAAGSSPISSRFIGPRERVVERVEVGAHRDRRALRVDDARPTATSRSSREVVWIAALWPMRPGALVVAVHVGRGRDVLRPLAHGLRALPSRRGSGGTPSRRARRSRS